MKYIFSTLLFALSLIPSCYAQDFIDLIIDEHYEGRNLQKVVDDLNRNFGIEILAIEEGVLNRKIKDIGQPKRILPFLSSQLKGYRIERITNKVVVIDTPTDEIIQYGFTNSSGPIELNIKDALTGEALIGASAINQDGSGTLSDENGMFSITPTSSLTEVALSYVGYEPIKYRLIISEVGNKNLSISMTSSNALDNIEILGKRVNYNVENKKIGVQSLKVENLKQLPTFMGDIDPIKGITTLPGVGSTGDISAGFHVRGGANSQNLILQDGMIIFNPTHLFGFFSAFNPDFIQSLNLHKGVGSARYGGRASSVLEINNKTGDLQKYKISGGIGAVSSRLTVEGPIQKGKSSFIVGGRKSYASWFLRNYEDVNLKNSFAGFQDVTAKFLKRIDEKNYVSLSGYYSYDDFNLGIDSTFTWGTKNIALKWDHIYNDEQRGELTLSSSNYNSKIKSEQALYAYLARNGISVNSVGYNHEYNASENLIILGGIQLNQNLIRPGELNPTHSSSIEEPRYVQPQNSLEASAYGEAEIDITDDLGVSAGIRYNQFMRYGPDKIHLLDYDNLDGRNPSIKETVNYKNNEFFSSYGGFEPRVSLRYKLFKNTSMKLGYFKTKQYISQITTTFSPSPFDFWTSSSPNIKPISADQYTMGLFQNLADNNIEFSLEGYYKNTDGVIDYIGGVNLDKNPLFEAGIIQGKNISYGIETILKKKTGKINGWISYTWMGSKNRFDHENDELDINNGNEYPSIYDKPHQFNSVVNIELTPNTILGFSFVYTTGQPLTIPISKFSYDDYLSIKQYSDRNSYRAPDYHRLDISLTFKRPHRYDRKYFDELVIGLYNVYGQKNAYSIFFDKYALAYKTSIIGSVIPSVSYNFKFN